ncbi:hypothetical protein FA13DRAFT_324074 [Coprinellus micaceus]|uniref:Uncharacterized protein n=1 Tax=Coprinellus micaceus TaxID=71717 RepID=A0A4Y7SDF4_COPMI|nr:hypothetical protein FA13DRAFT_324074 [Coprinellus micaceus]
MDLIGLESPANPTHKTPPITLIARIAREPSLARFRVRFYASSQLSLFALRSSSCGFPRYDLFLLAYNILASPFHQPPILLETDFDLHSLAKYVNGHAVVIPDPYSHSFTLSSQPSVNGATITWTSSSNGSATPDPKQRQDQVTRFYEKPMFCKTRPGDSLSVRLLACPTGCEGVSTVDEVVKEEWDEGSESPRHPPLIQKGDLPVCPRIWAAPKLGTIYPRTLNPGC